MRHAANGIVLIVRHALRPTIRVAPWESTAR